MKIIWTNSAQADYYNNIDYLLENWTTTEAVKFIEKVDQYLEIIKQNPITFSKSEYRNIHFVPVVNQITLYYHIGKNNIELLRFWNNNQNPQKLSL